MFDVPEESPKRKCNILARILYYPPCAFYIFTPANEVAGRYYFQSCLSVILSTGGTKGGSLVDLTMQDPLLTSGHETTLYRDPLTSTYTDIW